MSGGEMRRGGRDSDAAPNPQGGARRKTGAKRRKKKAGLPLWLKAGAVLGLAALGVGGAILATQQRGAHSQDPQRLAMATPSGGPGAQRAAPAPRAETREIWARLTSEAALASHFASAAGDARTHLLLLEALAADPGLSKEPVLQEAVRRAEAGDFAALAALAQTAYDESAAATPARRDAALALGALTFSGADPELGARLLQEAAEAQPEAVGPWVLLARTHFLTGRPTEALAALDRAAAAARDDFGRLAVVNARIDLGELLKTPEELTALAEEGLKLAKTLAEAAPADLEARRALLMATIKRADAALLTGAPEIASARYEEAKDLARGLAEARPGDPRTLRDQSELHLKAAQFAVMNADPAAARAELEAAVAFARRLSEATPENLRNLSEHGLALGGLADLQLALEDAAGAESSLQEALAVFERAVETAPQDLESAHNLSMSLQRLGDLALIKRDFAEARRRFERNFAMDQRLAEENPEFSPAQAALSLALRRLADLALEEDKPEEAVSRLKASLEIDESLFTRHPGDPEAATNLVGSLVRLAQADPAQARGNYERALGILRPLAEQNRLTPQHARGIPMIEQLIAQLPPV